MDPRETAIKRVKKRRNFFVGLIFWIITSTALFAVNILAYHGHWWAFYPFAIWGMSIVFQAIDIFGYGRAIEDWENKKIQKELKRMGHEEEYFDLNSPFKIRQKQKRWDDSELV